MFFLTDLQFVLPEYRVLNFVRRYLHCSFEEWMLVPEVVCFVFRAETLYHRAVFDWQHFTQAIFEHVLFLFRDCLFDLVLQLFVY